MNSTALFNKNYLKQNMKKSKAILLLCIVAMPIINALILLLVNNTSRGNDFVNSTYMLNALNFVGMYVIPEVIAICLFNYIFNKKSVDFVGSMPINRKSVYFTNLIGGILIIILLQALIALSTLVLIPFLGSIFIVPSMVFSSFIRYTIYYIFVYATAVLALSLSNNIFVQVVITLLITFFVPFLYDSFYMIGMEKYDIAANMSISIDGAERGLNSTKHLLVTTTPYYFIKMMLDSDVSYSYSLSNLLMVGLSILYAIFAGCFFYNKKMEHAEEGITNEKAHILVKAMTFLPFITFYEMVLTDNIIGSAIFFAVLFVYSIIYDIITKRKISFKMQVVSFVLIVAIYLGMFGIYNKIAENGKTTYYHKSDIASINVVVANKNGFNGDINYDEMISSNQIKYDITDEKVINHMLSVVTDEYYENYKYYSEDDSYGLNQRLAVKINFKDGKSGYEYPYLRGHAFEDTIDILSKDPAYYEAVKKDITLENDRSTEVVFDYTKASNEMKNEVLDNYNNTIPSSLREYYNESLELLDDEYNCSVGTIYKYKNNKVDEYNILINRKNAIGEDVARFVNNQTYNYLKEDVIESDYINISIPSLSRSIARKTNDYEKILLCRKYDEARYAQGSKLGREITNYILNSDEEFDINKDYYIMSISTENHKKCTYFTNSIDKINEIINARYDFIVDYNDLKPVYDAQGKILLDEDNYIVYEEDLEDEEDEYYYTR